MSSTSYTAPHSSPALPSVASEVLPPLPKIQSGQIRKRIFTHSSMAGGDKYPFQAPESDPSMDNEELGQIGDQVFGLAITDLIQKLYPHLRVGSASKVRDHIKRKSVIAEICVSYGLHKEVNLPERQADSLRASQSVQVNVFKAYVGGVYRDQGLEVVTKWLVSVFRPYVEARYQYLRNDYLMQPGEAIPQPRPPKTVYPSPPSSTSSEGAGPALPSHPARNPVDPHRSLPPRPQQGLGRAGGSVEYRPEDTDRFRGNRRRRRSIQGEGRNMDSDERGSPRRRRGPERSEDTRKRSKY